MDNGGFLCQSAQLHKNFANLAKSAKPANLANSAVKFFLSFQK